MNTAFSASSDHFMPTMIISLPAGWSTMAGRPYFSIPQVLAWKPHWGNIPSFSPSAFVGSVPPGEVTSPVFSLNVRYGATNLGAFTPYISLLSLTSLCFTTWPCFLPCGSLWTRPQRKASKPVPPWHISVCGLLFPNSSRPLRISGAIPRTWSIFLDKSCLDIFIPWSSSMPCSLSMWQPGDPVLESISRQETWKISLSWDCPFSKKDLKVSLASTVFLCSFIGFAQNCKQHIQKLVLWTMWWYDRTVLFRAMCWNSFRITGICASQLTLTVDSPSQVRFFHSQMIIKRNMRWKEAWRFMKMGWDH